MSLNLQIGLVERVAPFLRLEQSSSGAHRQLLKISRHTHITLTAIIRLAIKSGRNLPIGLTGRPGRTGRTGPRPTRMPGPRRAPIFFTSSPARIQFWSGGRHHWPYVLGWHGIGRGRDGLAPVLGDGPEHVLGILVHDRKASKLVLLSTLSSHVALGQAH